MHQSLKDIIAGFVSGWTQVFIMQPFQLVKIRLQTQSSANPYYHGMTDFQKNCQIVGITQLLQRYLLINPGTVTPLIGIGFQASAMFFTFEWAKRALRKFQQNPKQKCKLYLVPIAGLIASIPTSLVASPVEHARIRIQIQKTNSIYQGSVDAAIKIAKSYGIKGLYKGNLATWIRQAIGQATYFTVYETILRSFIPKGQKQAPLIAALGAGAMAGISFFLAAYPADYIKTLLQTDNLEISEAKFSNIRDAIKQRYQAAGVGTFYKGLGVTLYRSAAVNAGGFFAFQTTLRLLGKQQEDH